MFRLSKEAYRQYLLPVFLIFCDYAAVVAAEHIAFVLRDWLDFWRHSHYMYDASYIYGWVPLLFLIFFAHSRTYRQMQPIVDTMRDIFFSVLWGLIACIIVVYFLKASEQASRLFIIIFGGLVLFNIYALRYAVMKIFKRYRIFYEPVILIGAGKTAERVLNFFNSDLGYRYEIRGIIDDAPVSHLVANRFLLYGGFSEAEEIITKAKVANVIITAPGLKADALQALITKIQPHVRTISFVPDLIGTPMAGVEANILFSEKILLLRLRNNLARMHNRVLKRFFDLFCTVFGGLAISPLLLGIALCVAVENRGRIIFAHERVGQNGKLFRCYKFRTMVPDAEERLQKYLAENPAAKEEWEATFKLTHDPRVTKLGAVLRRTSLDELPQLINVLRGEMSLVGPRPIVTEEIPRYGDNIREYYMVLPGLTGMWQVSGRSDTTYEERVAMDTWYVRNWSVWIDLMYLFKTVKAVFYGKGAY